ncbi:MAG: hypothetical protein WAK00_05635 [Microbacterium sp.]|uniref:hypothetical protein n=1 Tax=Microbacterium sp. TaxID=51671 RepID=UPI003BAECFD9
MTNESGTAFDSGDAATIATGMKVITKLGRVVIDDGHLGLLRENGDLIDSAPLSAVTLKKGLTYALVPTLHVLLSGKKYLVNLSYEAHINAGLGDAEAKEAQRDENTAFVELVRRLGGEVKGL